jgi:hypothetical protein
MSGDEKFIDVFPDLKNKRSNKKNSVPIPVDNDVEMILNDKNNLNDTENILNGESQKTNEEKENKNEEKTNTTWLYIILCLSIIVVVLIIVVAWYNLCKPCKIIPTGIPNNMLNPGQMHPGQMHPGQMHPGQMHPGQMHPGQMHPSQMHPGQMHPGQMHPGQRSQSEQLPVKSNTISKPTKKELLSTLNKIKLEPIIEENIDSEITEKKSTTSNQLQTEQEHNGVDGIDEQDTDLSKKFYKNLEQNIDNDEKDNNSDDGKDKTDEND